jgi:hypothetical protein
MHAFDPMPPDLNAEDPNVIVSTLSNPLNALGNYAGWFLGNLRDLMGQLQLGRGEGGEGGEEGDNDDEDDAEGEGEEEEDEEWEEVPDDDDGQ